MNESKNWQNLPENAIFDAIATHLTALRKSYNFSQKELAKATDLSTRTIQRIESGESLNLNTIIRVFRVYGRLNDLQKLFENTRNVDPFEMLKQLKDDNR